MKWLRKRSTGCTLVEVMTVTGALASLGSGAFTGAMDAARRDVCLTNLRQLGQYIQMFAEENDGMLPRAWFLPKDALKDPGSIMSILLPSVKQKELFLCPAAPDAVRKFGLSYLWNDQLSGIMLDQVPNPSQVWMMTDINAAATAITLQQAQQASINLKAIPPAHLEGYNVLYVDGHVKWSKEPPRIQPVIQPQRQRAQPGDDDD
jgi:prepilin-type processing-associated H-X9-DG protein